MSDARINRGGRARFPSVLTVIPHHDVTELRFSTWRSRSVGFRVRAFVVRGVLIDSGPPSGAAALARYIAASRPRGALITHFHEDHAGGVGALINADVPLWMDGRTAARVLTPPRIGFYRRYTWGSPTPARPHAAFELPDALTAIATPGHSEDHHVVWDSATGTLFGGDLFIGVKVRGAHRSEQPRALVQSLRQVMALAPARLCDAHRGLVTNPVPLLAAKAAWMERTLDAIDTRIARGEADAAIARAVLGHDKLARWFTGGDYTMANFVAAARAESQTVRKSDASPDGTSRPADATN